MSEAGIWGIGPLPEGELDLPLIPWEGGPSYYTVAQSGDKMSKAEAMGWGEDTFFPISVWLSDPAHADELAAIGINTYFGIFANTGAINTAAAAGMSIIPQANEWTPAEVTAETTGRDNCVAWLPIDEPELNASFATYMTSCSDLKALDDGRFLITNFCHGIRRTVYYVTSTGGGSTQMHDACAENDVASADQYCYTSPGIRGDNGPQGICDNANFPTLWDGTSYLWQGDYQDGTAVDKAAAYGWQADALRSLYTDQDLLVPIWVAVESQMPYLTDTGRDIILYEEIRGATYAAIVHEARGLFYFQHNGFYSANELGPGNPATSYTANGGDDPNTGLPPNQATMSLVDGDAALRDYVADLNAEVLSLAPVLNTQSYEFDFGATLIDTMLKAKDGFAYIFACLSQLGTTGSKTFTLTGTGITGTNVEVVNESRSLTVSGGQFADTFANEYTAHIYKIAI